MQHPSLMSDQQLRRNDQRSPLMKLKAKTQSGDKVNCCPYGCTIAQLDENGYCRHLIGFTNDGKTYEPMVRINGRRIVQVPLVAGEDKDEDGTALLVPKLPQVRKDDLLVPITTSSRVYRNVQASGPVKAG